MNDGRWLIAALACMTLWACPKPPAPAATAVRSAVPSIGDYKAPTREASGRGAVQHGIDPGAAKVDRIPNKISVEQLLAMRKKIGDNVELASYPDKRIAPFETCTFAIDATIKSIKHEKDGDFYFVIEGDSGARAVVEVPDPSLCQGSPMLADIVKARQTLYDKFHPTDADKTVNEKATITGVGYLGSRKRRGSGSFGAAARLMPGTGISFAGGSSDPMAK